MASIHTQIAGRGGEVVALVVDPPGRNAAMARRWHLSFPIESDPGGETWLQPLGLWNAGERGGIGVPSVWVVAPDGDVAFHYRSREFSDRTDDDDMLAALNGVGQPGVDPPPWEPDVAPEEDPGAFRTDAFGAYFRGVASGSLGLSVRFSLAGDGEAARECNQQRQMALSFTAAWKAVRAALG